MKQETMSRGERNCNPLNIVKGSKWKGLRAEQTDKRFCQFESMAYGWRAALILIRNYINGTNSAKIKFNTIEKIINRWAPQSENNTQAYIRLVVQISGIPRSQILFWEHRKSIVMIVQAMAYVECGRMFPLEDIQSAYDLLSLG